MSNLVRSTQKHLATGGSVSGAAGKGMVAAGGGTLAVLGIAALIPFVNALVIAIALIGLGVLFWE